MSNISNSERTITMTVYFYSTREKPYGCFSNFSRHGFELDGLWWATCEHYFQAQKFVSTDTNWAEKIREAKTPKNAAKMGRSRQHPLRKDWEGIKDQIMEQERSNNGARSTT